MANKNSRFTRRRRSFACRPSVEQLEIRTLLSTFGVTNTLDNGAGSLRDAIIAANATADVDRIEFNIPGDGVHTISPTSPLPAISQPIIIDGYSQPGSSPNNLAIGDNAVLLVEINGILAGYCSGLEVTGGSSLFRGLVINRFAADGIRLLFSSNNVVEGNFIGTDPGGSIELGNSSSGVSVFNSTGNLIGGTNPAARNVLSGNSVGVAIAGSGTLVIGNYIGTTAAGDAALPNVHGVGVSVNGNNTVIGGGDGDDGILDGLVGARNVISGNSETGILIDTNANGPLSDVTIQGNIIGLNAAGSLPLGNVGAGIINDGRRRTGITTIGGTLPGTGNVISANALTGLSDFAMGTIVQGNFIGTDVTGTIDRGNGAAGVHSVFGGMIIGGSTLSSRNLISGNATDGIFLGGPANLIQGNLIGTAIDGVSPLGNGGRGISVNFGGLNTIGGTVAGEGNTVAHNALAGILLNHSNSRASSIRGNSIFANGLLGIDLADFETSGIVNQNDPGDADAGANNRQNFPEISQAALSGSTLTLQYVVPSSTANSAYPLRVEFFRADADGQEGQTFLGFDTYDLGEAELTTTVAIATGNIAAGDRIVATATDAAGNTSEFSPNVVVQQGNSPPFAIPDFFVINEDTDTILDLTLNDIDPDHDPLTVLSVTPTLLGTVQIIGAGQVLYRPNQNQFGDDSFIYVVTDLQSGTSSALVQVKILNVNDPPTANPDDATTTVGQPITIDVLANDTDPDNDVLSVAFADGESANGGDVAVNPDGTVTYTPRAGFQGSDFFHYTIVDAQGETATATVSISVLADNSPAVAISHTLRAGLESFFAGFDEWAQSFDLSTTGSFALPGLTGELNQLVDVTGAIQDLVAPLPTSDSQTFVELKQQLELLGFTINCMSGGLSGVPACDGDDLIQIRYERSPMHNPLPQLSLSQDFSGNAFNDDTVGLLDGLSGENAFDVAADFQATADLSLLLVFGVDGTGFYVLDESGMRLDLDASGTVIGGGSLLGEPATITGSLSTTDLQVNLFADGGAARLRLNDLDGTPPLSSILVPSASGQVNVLLQGAAGPLDLSASAKWTLTADAKTHTVSTDVIFGLTGTFNLLDLQVAGGGSAANLRLVGVFDNGTWDLSFDAAASVDYELLGFTLKDLHIGAVITPNSLTGEFSPTTTARFGEGADPDTLGIAGSFNRQRMDLTATLDIADRTLGSPAILKFEDVQLTLDLHTVFGGATTGGLEFSAAEAALFPRASGDGLFSAEVFGLAGKVDVSGKFDVQAARVAVAVGDALLLTARNVGFHFDPAAPADAVLAQLNNITVTFPAYPDFPTASIANVEIRRNQIAIDQLEIVMGTRAASPGVPDWVEQGPGPINNAQLLVTPNSPVGGAVQAIAVNPNNPANIYLGTVNGGVWRTTNADPINPQAITWTPLTDQFGSLSIGALAISPADATGNTVFAGVGQFSNAFDGGNPLGLLRTTNGGNTWTLLGADVFSNQRIKTIVPTASPVVLVGTIDGNGRDADGSRNYADRGGGLYRSTDGGETFTLLSASNGLPAEAVTTIVTDPNNPATFYAAIPGQGVFQSSNGGQDWTPFNTNLTSIAGSSDIELAVMNNVGATVLYAAVATGNTLNGVFRSAGGNWTALAAPPAAFDAGDIYHEKLQLVADPTDPDVVYLAGQSHKIGRAHV